MVVRHSGRESELINVKCPVVGDDVAVIPQANGHPRFVFDILSSDEAVNQFKDVE